MHEGHIKVYRRLKKSPYYKDSQYVHLWLHLLLEVDHTPNRVKVRGLNNFIELKPGQVLTSRDRLAEQTGISSSKVERMLKVFEIEQQIEQQTYTKYRIITIVNWISYQKCEQQIEQQVNSKRTASEQQVNSKRTASEQQVNSKRTASEQQVNTNKNDKNEKKEDHAADIIQIFHNTLPELPAVRKVSEALKRKLSARWNEDGQDTLGWWQDYFMTVKQSAFLTGKKTDFRASLDWLVGPENMSKVLNGQYTDSHASHQPTNRPVDWSYNILRGTD